MGLKFYLQPLSQHVSEVNQSLKQTPEAGLSPKTQAAPRGIADSEVNQSLKQTPEGALSPKTQVAPRGIEDTPNAPKTSVSVCIGPVAPKCTLNANCLSELKTLQRFW